MNDVDIETLRRLLVEARTTIDELSAENYALRCELVRYRSEDEARRRHPSTQHDNDAVYPQNDAVYPGNDACNPHGIRRPTLHLIGGKK
jgi:hypothetical protein